MNVGTKVKVDCQHEAECGFTGSVGVVNWLYKDGTVNVEFVDGTEGEFDRRSLIEVQDEVEAKSR